MRKIYENKTAILLLTFLLMAQAIFAKSGSSSGIPIDKMKAKFPQLSSQGLFETDKYCCRALERYMDNEVEIVIVNMACHENWSEDSYTDIVVMLLEYTSCIMDDGVSQQIINNF